MLEALTSLLTLFIVLCAFSVVVSPMLGRRLDPFLLSRPIGRVAIRLPARAVHWLSRRFNHWSGQAWKRAYRTQSLSLKIFLFFASAALGTLGLLLTIPGEILGEVKRL